LTGSLKEIRITLDEERGLDAWFDLSLRGMREGLVNFYRVKDLLTGDWLFKVCSDNELEKSMVKAVKCPAGKYYSQIEGNTMVFQKSIFDDLYYDIISLTYVDGEGRVRREAVNSVEEIPPSILEFCEVKSYDEATGKTTPLKYIVTLTPKGDEKKMITLFLLERARPLLPLHPELDSKVLAKTPDILKIIEELEKAQVEEICTTVEERLGINREDTPKLLNLLKERGKIIYPSEGYVKRV
jgi:hypothetical protein